MKPCIQWYPWLKLTDSCGARLLPGVCVHGCCEYSPMVEGALVNLAVTHQTLFSQQSAPPGCWRWGLSTLSPRAQSSGMLQQLCREWRPSKARAGPVGLQGGSSGAEEPLIPRERVGWEAWGSSNSKQLPEGLPEVVCQQPSFAPAQSNICTCTGGLAWQKQAPSIWARGHHFRFAQALQRLGETVQECCALNLLIYLK